MSFGLGASQGVAYADRPPPVDPTLLPAGDPAAPPDKTEQKSNAPCVSTQQGGAGPTTPIPQLALNLDTAQKFSQGAGQLVAVIDTGVARHPRLPDLDAGGDYVAEGGDGTSDCDAHGTVVAGIIGAKPVAGQGFSGVAPDARILTIRQNSGLFQKAGRTGEQRPEDGPDGYGPIYTLASAVRRAADRGATVINISLVLCAERSHNLDDGALGAALRYATLEHNAVVVVAAGNKEKACNAGNPDVDPVNPRGDLWKNLNTNITPARFDDYVLAVGSVDKNGQPSKFTVPGPWLGVAAPGEDIVSLDARGTGTITGFVNEQQGVTPLQGTSFAAPYVAGVVALVRARFPELSALEVIKRIEATAHAPAEGWNPYVGYGAIDPVAALTDEVPPTLPPKQATSPNSKQLAVPAPTPPPDNRARNIALIGSGTVAILLILGMLASFPIRRRFGISGDDM
ncbi:type VII secretion-associated serine protease mycosin [Nocardia sp. NPDC051052]|uniref:type VII secretion-associated serine protease mycosin n=1 Tax=Nocardia sp. NPDC051052 TaxID=3364322 RepID=UPI00379F377A